ncbi:hypothetical protein [Legionella sp.]|uniref:hypothetical protein n=1 Tax=Legionella sp. TaxID=459 RepID=UPI003C811C0C
MANSFTSLPFLVTGDLSDIPGSPFATGIAISPNGQFVYVVNCTDGTISAYIMN